ncbi:MAG: pyridoxamine 5'-phosphate oxidase family protein [Pseudomonadaceae bacterium]|nr:pyridoxamine 5'-phosphate oxidase family protein [Pseudomonadaceae bacterium]
MSASDNAAELRELLSEFDNGLLVTVDDKRLHGRPMHIAERKEAS